MSGPGTPEVVTRAPLRAAVIRRRTVPMTEIRDAFDSGFTTLGATLGQQGVAPASAAFARYFGPPGESADLEIGYGVDADVAATDEVEPVEIPGGLAAQLVHAGGYDGLGAAWERLDAWTREQGLTPGEWLLEEYLTEPTPDADPADMRTRLTIVLDAG